MNERDLPRGMPGMRQVVREYTRKPARARAQADETKLALAAGQALHRNTGKGPHALALAGVLRRWFTHTDGLEIARQLVRVLEADP